MNTYILFGKFMKIPHNIKSMGMNTKKTLPFLENPIEKPFDQPINQMGMSTKKTLSFLEKPIEKPFDQPVKFPSDVSLGNSFETK